MLTFVKEIFKAIAQPAVYFGGYLYMIYTMFRKVHWGFYLLVFLIPQPNIWYRFHDYPLGKDYMDFLYLSVVLGILIQKKIELRTLNSTLVFAFSIFTYLSLWNSSLRFNLPIPVTLDNRLLYDIKNYIQMIFLYFLAYNLTEDDEERKKIIFIICLVLFIIAFRNYRNFWAGSAFRYEKRSVGPFAWVGLGPNHLGAFVAHFGAFFLGMFFYDKENRKRNLFYLATAILSLHPLFFSYSRGAYIAAFAALLVFGLKKRILFAGAVAVLIFWHALLPESVVDRITMTTSEDGQLESSADMRTDMWSLAFDVYAENPAFGVGFYGYTLSVGGKVTESGYQLSDDQDVHSIYMRIICEGGVIGIALFLSILGRSFISGYRLYAVSRDNFHRAIGFGFVGCVVALAITNLFGDRWSYFPLGGYFWILWGLVDKTIESINRTELVES